MSVSSCCGAPPKMLRNGDNDTEDIGICPMCGDHCDYIDEEDTEDFDIPENYDPLRSSNIPTKEEFSNWKKLK